MKKSADYGFAKDYDQDLFGDDTETRRFLYGSDTGALPTHEHVVSDPLAYDAHDYRHLKEAYSFLGFESEEPATRPEWVHLENIENKYGEDETDDRQNEMADLLELLREEKIDLQGLKTLEDHLKAVPLSKNLKIRSGQVAALMPVLNEVKSKLVKAEAQETAQRIPIKLEEWAYNLSELKNEAHTAINKKAWQNLEKINPKMISLANEINNGLDLMRRNNPDELIMVPQSMEGSVRGLFKNLLIKYFETHKVELSSVAVNKLRDLALKQKGFFEALHNTYAKISRKRDHDDALGFIQKATGIPYERLTQAMAA